MMRNYDLVHFGRCLETFECCTAPKYDPATGYFPFYFDSEDDSYLCISLDDACLLARALRRWGSRCNAENMLSRDGDPEACAYLTFIRKWRERREKGLPYR